MKNRSRRARRAGFLTLGILAAGQVLVFLDTPHEGSTLVSLQAQTIRPARPKKTDQSVHDTWDVISLDGQRIGYTNSTTQTITRNGQTIIRTNSEMHMTIKRFGKVLKMQTLSETEETRKGDLLSFSLEVRNPPASPNRTVGRVEGNRLYITSTTAGQTTKTFKHWNPGVKSSDYQVRLLRESMMKPGETRSLRAFFPMLNDVQKVILAADEYRFVKMFDGKTRKLLKIRVTQSNLPETRAFLDAKGNALRTETDMLGKLLVTYQVSAAEALKAIEGKELDFAVISMVQVTPIRGGHRTKRVVYRLTTRGQDSTKFVPVGPTQQIKKIDEDTLELTVTALPVPQILKKVPADPEFLATTRFLQCRDPRVIEHARRAAAGQTNAAKVAVQMEKYVNRKLVKKNFSTALASAAEVAKNLEGDCTEHAVLLAAMLRARKIPSRIAVGLVYIEHLASFGGHMWTEAWLDGKWIPLDATLGQGGIGAAHIKLSESSFADDAPSPVTAFLPLMKILGKLQIEVVKAE